MVAALAHDGHQAAHRVVVTEVDRSWTRPLADWLGPNGVAVLWARSGPEVVEIVEEQTVHLAVLETNLPRLDGLGVLRLMRQSDIQVPCVLVAGSPDASVLEEALRWDAYSVVRKPVDQELLSRVVAQVFRRFYDVQWA